MKVDQASPAALADLRAGDKIIAIDGRRLEDEDAVQAMLEPLMEAKLVVERVEGQAIEVGSKDPMGPGGRFRGYEGSTCFRSRHQHQNT